MKNNQLRKKYPIIQKIFNLMMSQTPDSHVVLNRDYLGLQGPGWLGFGLKGPGWLGHSLWVCSLWS